MHRACNIHAAIIMLWAVKLKSYYDLGESCHRIDLLVTPARKTVERSTEMTDLREPIEELVGTTVLIFHLV